MRLNKYYLIHEPNKFPRVFCSKPREDSLPFVEMIPMTEHEEKIKSLKVELDLLKLKIKAAVMHLRND